MIRSSRGWKEYLINVKYSENLFNDFEMRAREVSTEVHRVKSIDESYDVLSNLADETNARKIAWVKCPLTEVSKIKENLETKGLQVFTNLENIAPNIHDTDIGISGVEFGIAECGSLCQDASSIESRLVSSLPPVHVAFLNSRHILPGIEDALDIISKSFDQGYITWITGPSRTADIERVLTIGVHGPSRFLLIAVDDKDGEGL